MIIRAARLAIATMTLVRDPDEEAMLRWGMEALTRIGCPVIVTDGGSPCQFVESLRGLPGLTLTTPSGQGLVDQVRTSLEACAKLDADFLLYTEPDKLDFFEHHLRGSSTTPSGRRPVSSSRRVRLTASRPFHPHSDRQKGRSTVSAVSSLVWTVTIPTALFSFGRIW
ncbi:MAG: hypothetical protein H0W08_24480 [Acidobacteria bacterium]|nr:hypothetical protein [Acidobacteriota bacterium]